MSLARRYVAPRVPETAIRPGLSLTVCEVDDEHCYVDWDNHLGTLGLEGYCVTSYWVFESELFIEVDSRRNRQVALCRVRRELCVRVYPELRRFARARHRTREFRRGLRPLLEHEVMLRRLIRYCNCIDARLVPDQSELAVGVILRPPPLIRQYGSNPRGSQIGSSHGEITEGDDLSAVNRRGNYGPSRHGYQWRVRNRHAGRRGPNNFGPRLPPRPVPPPAPPPVVPVGVAPILVRHVFMHMDLPAQEYFPDFDERLVPYAVTEVDEDFRARVTFDPQTTDPEVADRRYAEFVRARQAHANMLAFRDPEDWIHVRQVAPGAAGLARLRHFIEGRAARAARHSEEIRSAAEVIRRSYLWYVIKKRIRRRVARARWLRSYRYVRKPFEEARIERVMTSVREWIHANRAVPWHFRHEPPTLNDLNRPVGKYTVLMAHYSKDWFSLFRGYSMINCWSVLSEEQRMAWAAGYRTYKFVTVWVDVYASTCAYVAGSNVQSGRSPAALRYFLARSGLYDRFTFVERLEIEKLYPQLVSQYYDRLDHADMSCTPGKTWNSTTCLNMLALLPWSILWSVFVLLRTMSWLITATTSSSRLSMDLPRMLSKRATSSRRWAEKALLDLAFVTGLLGAYGSDQISLRIATLVVLCATALHDSSMIRLGWLVIICCSLYGSQLLMYLLHFIGSAIALVPRYLPIISLSCVGLSVTSLILSGDYECKRGRTLLTLVRRGIWTVRGSLDALRVWCVRTSTRWRNQGSQIELQSI